MCFPQTWMRKNFDQKWTHLRPTNGDRVQLDLFVCRRQWRGSFQNISTDHSAGLNSNHRLVTAKIWVKRGKPRMRTQPPKFNRKPTDDEASSFQTTLDRLLHDLNCNTSSLHDDDIQHTHTSTSHKLLRNPPPDTYLPPRLPLNAPGFHRKH